MANGITYGDPNHYTATVKIAAAGTTSEALSCANKTIVGVIVPVAMTGTSMKFQGSMNDITYYDVLKSDGTNLAITLTGVGMYKVYAADLVGLEYVRLVSNGAEAAERTLSLVVARVTNGTR